MNELPMICLLTDFGLSDHYVGVMKAVILSEVPHAQIVDLTHNIPPQNVRVAAYQLLASYRFHPEGTLFLCVVDPGVGSARKILYTEAGPWKFIAPDNGLLSWVLEREKPVRIFDISHPPSLPGPVSKTFQGRDIMAPVAARILKGEKPELIGKLIKDVVRLPFPVVKKVGALWKGEVLAVDAFGNLITNFPSIDVAPLASHSKIWFELEKHPTAVRGLVKSYEGVDDGKLLAIEGSSGFIEISVRNGNAAEQTHLKMGSAVALHFRT